MDVGKKFEFTLYDVLHIVRCAWEQVSGSTIRICFAKAKFIEVEYYYTKPDSAKLFEISKAVPTDEKMHESKEIKLSDILEADERLETGQSFTLEEIAEEMLRSKEPVECEDDNITIKEETIFSFENAQRAWITVWKFMRQRSEKLGVMRACDRSEDKIHEIDS